MASRPARSPRRSGTDPYRFLVCADKFQTGYDEPLLHTMYVDKTLSGIKAVQTMSRLNRAHPKKHDVFVLDFLNDADTIRDAFTDFYRATILAGETDPDKLHDLQADLDDAQVYSPEQIDDLVERYLGGADRDELDPILDVCVAVYVHELDEDAQVDFKGKAKAFVRTYGFLSCVLPYTNAEWEKRSIFLNFLISKLPAPEEEDLSKGILDAIDMDSYRVEKRAVQKILLPDEHAESRTCADQRRRPRAGARAGPALEHPPGVQRPIRQHRLGRSRPRRRADHQDDPRQGRRGRRLPERPGELRRRQRPHRARQGAGPDRHRHGERRRRAVQAVHGQRGLQAVDDGHGCSSWRATGRRRGDLEPSPNCLSAPSAPFHRMCRSSHR